MSGRGKGKSSKKAVSRSAKAGLQFPVGRIARYVLLHRLHFLQSMMTRAIWMRWKCISSSNTTILKLQALTLNSLSIHKQIPQGWQIRHPCWCRRPGLLGRGLGILSGWSSRTRRERFQRQQKVQNRTETHPIGHQKRRGIVQVVGHGHDRVWRCLAEHPLGLVAEEVQEVNCLTANYFVKLFKKQNKKHWDSYLNHIQTKTHKRDFTLTHHTCTYTPLDLQQYNTCLVIYITKLLSL